MENISLKKSVGKKGLAMAKKLDISFDLHEIGGGQFVELAEFKRIIVLIRNDRVKAINDVKGLLKEACELLFMGREYNDFDLIRLEDLQNKPEVKKIMEGE